MCFYGLHESGYFYANGSIIKVSRKPDGVRGYIIYKDVEKPVIVKEKRRIVDMRDYALIEVVTDGKERIFFAYDGKKFISKKFKSVDILEGEDELLKHLGLLGLKPRKVYNEIPF